MPCGVPGRIWAYWAWWPVGHKGTKEGETEADWVSGCRGFPVGPFGAMLQDCVWGSQHPPTPYSIALQCVVIGLQSTGEARTREVLDEKDGQLDCFVSAAE